MNKPTDRAQDRPADSLTAQDSRKARLAEQLRANLQKRKAQARSRRAGQADDDPPGLAQPDDKE